MRIGGKLKWAFGIILFMLVGEILLSIFINKNAKESYQYLHGLILPSQSTIQQIQSTNTELQLLLQHRLFNKSLREINRIKVISEVELPVLSSDLLLLRELDVNEKINQTILEINRKVKEQILISAKINRLLFLELDYQDEEKLSEIRSDYNNFILPNSTKIKHLLSQLEMEFTRLLNESEELNRSKLKFLTNTLIISGIIAIIFSLYVTFQTIRSITKPIEILKSHVAQIENGKFNTSIDLPTKDEFHELGLGITRMAKKIDHSFHKVKLKTEEAKQFTYIATHDLQEPMTSLKSFIQLLKTYFQPGNEGAEKCFDYIDGTLDKMSTLIHGLMEYSRVSNYQERSKIDLNKLVHSIKDEVSLLLQECKGNIAILELPKIIGNEQSMHLIYQNLITNSIKFRSPDRPLRIEIGVFKKDGRNIYFVKDNGIGMGKQHQGKIFELFQTLHNEKAKIGVGIGLSQTKKVIQEMGGEIWVESHLNAGSTFFFTLG